VLKGKEGPEMVCARCRKHFWPRVAGYMFLILSPRGRCRMPHLTEARSVLCLGCGIPLREYLEASAYTIEPAYDNAGKDWKGKPYDREREGECPGVSGSDDHRAGRGEDDNGVVAHARV